jgi:uncharacterized SAM-binding protein YcdF (DUF218 family)
VLLAFILWLWVVLVLVLVIDAYGRRDFAQPADVIIVLGAGLRADNTPGPALVRRAAHAAHLWQTGYAPVIICSGGKPGIRTRSEADACAELLRADGVPAEAIVLEDRSRSTEENAFESKIVMDANSWQTAIVVSDKYHLFRAYRLFRNAGIPIYTSPTPDDPTPLEYLVYLGREVVAFHWQLFKEALNLPITYVQSI